MRTCSLFFLFTSLLLTSTIDLKAAEPLDVQGRRIATTITKLRSQQAIKILHPDIVITPDTFKAICGIVQSRAKKISREEGIIIRHVATKYRNKKHAPSKAEKVLLQRFSTERSLREIKGRIKRDGKQYYRYSQPITVENSCLYCHGKKKNRPDFIKQWYPEDKAFNYQAGDLRAMIQVLIPLD